MTSQLTDLVRAGSLSDFGYLFERYRHQATDYARRLMDQPADADELVADAFERVLDIMRRGLGPDDDGFWSYLVVTLRHRANSFRRQRAHERLTDDEVLTQIAASDELAAIATEQKATGCQISLVRAFKRLPNNYRVILLLTAVEQQPLVLVGPILGLSPNGASALAYRARARLRELYQLEAQQVHAALST